MQATTGRFLATLTLSAAVLAACGGSDDRSTTTTEPTTEPTTESTTEVANASDLPACSDLFIDGAVITGEQWDAGCIGDDGALVVAVAYGYDCGTAFVNDLGWGYADHPFHAGAELPGLDVISQCGEA